MDDDLHLAAYNCELECVQRSLRAGADVGKRDVSGYMPLHWAAFRSRVGHDPEGVVRALLAAGADAHSRTAAGESALVLACRSGSAPVVRLLIESGANVNDPCRSETPLTAAAQSGCVEAVRVLLERGADRSARGPFGLTALERAEADGFDEIAELLRAGTPFP